MKEPILLIMAAGMGSRYGGLKQMDPIGPRGEFILDYSLFDAKRAGFTRAVIVIKKENEMDFREVLGNNASRHMQISYAYQDLLDIPEGVVIHKERKKPWGTGHAVLAARNLVDAPFCAINADDFYGKNAFALAYQHLSQCTQDDDLMMVGYHLNKTLSPTGFVARGVCEVTDENTLTHIVERTHIIDSVDGPLMSEDLQTYTRLSPETIVSMNMWGIPRKMMEWLADSFKDFLSENAGSLTAEFFLPTVVAEQIAKNQAVVHVETTPDKWHGVTYREDRKAVQTAIADMTTDGVYPTPLWNKE